MMLQVITGKFFTTEELNVTRQRGILFTNYFLSPFDKIETVSGTLLPADTWTEVKNLIYEVDQKLEANDKDGNPSFMIATHFDPLIQDFAAITSFVLDITCSPDIDLTHRLTQSTRPQIGINQIPKQFIKRVFDTEISPTEGDQEKLQEFMIELVGLERRYYEPALRSIRRYVTGLHRIGDDLDLAYTLLVASIEALAQEFDNFIPTWKDYEEKKRKSIDNALKRASPNTVKKVQDAILAQEHTAIARRFVEFTLANVKPSFFREETADTNISISRSEIPVALKEAYKFRSKYVHTLVELPKVLKSFPSHNDTFDYLGKPLLTFQGLARIAKHVIKEFIRKSPKIERENYDYRSNLPNIVYGLQFAQRYWIWKAEGFNHKSAYRYLNGFLDELSEVLMNQEGSQITNIDKVLEAIEKQIKGLGNYKKRLPMLTLYLLSQVHLPENAHRPNCWDLMKKYADDFKETTPESMLVSTLVKDFVTLSVDEFESARNAYFSQKFNKNVIVIGKVFEAAITLQLAEMHRQNENETRSRELISEAVKYYPNILLC